MVQIKIYSKADCHLCDEMKEVIISVQSEADFEVLEIDITKDPELFEQYKYEIPVVFIEGKKAFKYKMTREEFLRRIKRK